MKFFSRIKRLINGKKVVCYYRCSRKNRQEHMRQKFICENFAIVKGYEIDNEFSEIVTGNATLDERASMLDCITYCIKNRIKTIVISEVDRFSRNLQTAKDIMDIVKPIGINFVFGDYSIDTSKGQKQIDKLLEQVEMAQYEMQKIKYRLHTGLARYIKAGGKMGRNAGYRKTKEQKRIEYADVLKLLSEGYSIRKVAEKCGICNATVVSLKKEFKGDY